MNIGIFETQHFEGAYPMIRILDMPGNHLFIYVNEETHRRFCDLFGKDMEKYTWIIQPATMSGRRFILEIFNTCKRNNIQLLFLNTVTAHFILYGWMAAFLRSARVVLTLHDSNNFLQSRYTFSLRKNVRHTGKKILGRFCYAYSTVSETVQEYLQKEKKIKKPVFCIPGAVFERQHTPPMQLDAGTRLVIVVPGSIDKRRRNYNQVVELLDQVNMRSMPVTVVLAGGPYSSYGEEMLQKFRKYSLLQNNLIFYEKPVLDQDVFDAALDAAHFIWIPSVIETVIADDISETYGLTKSSGNIFDAIKHARPLIVPQALTIQQQLFGSVYKYANMPDLVNYLEKILQDPGIYQQLSRDAFTNSMKYTAEKMRERIGSLITDKPEP